MYWSTEPGFVFEFREDPITEAFLQNTFGHKLTGFLRCLSTYGFSRKLCTRTSTVSEIQGGHIDDHGTACQDENLNDNMVLPERIYKVTHETFRKDMRLEEMRLIQAKRKKRKRKQDTPTAQAGAFNSFSMADQRAMQLSKRVNSENSIDRCIDLMVAGKESLEEHLLPDLNDLPTMLAFALRRKR